MIDKPTRNHWIVVIQDIINSVKQLIVFILLMLAYKGIYVYIIGAVVLIGIIAMSVKEWHNTEYYVKDNMLVYKTGIFQSSKQEISFDKINTIDIGKSLLEGIFDVCTVKIDSGSVGKDSEFKIKIQCDLAEDLRDTILKAKNNNTNCVSVEEGKEEKFIERVITIKEIVIYAVTKGKLAWALGCYFAVMNYADDVERLTKTSIVKSLLDSINLNNLFSENKTKLIIMVIGMLLLVYSVITLFSIVFEVVKFYNFTVKVKDKNFNISYGMINKKEYTIPIEKIHALKYKQSILQQLLGIYTQEVITIGYGDEKGEKAILYPIANNKFSEEFLGDILPELLFLGKAEKPPKRSLKKFIFMRVFISLVILIPIYLIFKDIPSGYKLGGIVTITLINVLLGYLNYKNTSLGITEKVILASSGSLTKKTTIIKQDSVQSIEKIQNPYQRKDKVCDYKIDIYSNNLGDAVKVRHMSEEVNGKLYGELIM